MDCRPTHLQALAYGFLDGDAERRVREHLESCGRCRADLERLAAERRLLARAAAAPAPRARALLLVPAAFAAAMLAGLLWLLMPHPAPPNLPPVAAQQKEKTPAQDSLESLEAQMRKLETAFENTKDPDERARILSAINEFQARLARMIEGRKPAEPEPKKPVTKGKSDPNLDRISKLKMELESVYRKMKSTTDPAETAKLEKIAQDLGQEIKLLSQGDKPEVNLKEMDNRLRENPDDVDALVKRASGYLDSAKAAPALKDLNRAIELKPDCAPAYLKRAVAHAWLGNKDQAWADAKRGEELDRTAGKAIDETYGAIKKILAPKERRSTASDMTQQIATLKERLEELQAAAANADLPAADRDRAKADAARVQAEIDKLQADLKSAPADAPVKKGKP